MEFILTILIFTIQQNNMISFYFPFHKEIYISNPQMIALRHEMKHFCFKNLFQAFYFVVVQIGISMFWTGYWIIRYSMFHVKCVVIRLQEWRNACSMLVCASSNEVHFFSGIAPIETKFYFDSIPHISSEFSLEL